MTENDLPAVTAIARQAFYLDSVTEGIVAEKTVRAPDRVAEVGLVWEEGGSVWGFAQGAMGVNADDLHRGYVRLLAVEPAWQRRGIGSALLEELERRLCSLGATEISIMDVPQNYFMPGLDFRYTSGVCFLLAHGYRMVHENHNMMCHIEENRWGDLDAEAEGFRGEGLEIRRAGPADWPALEELLAEHWPAWRDEVSRALALDPPGVFVACRAPRVAAFAAYRGNNRDLSWFGPMGTSPELRGKGVGALLLRLCLRDLARQGWNSAIIPWVGPICFYARTCDAWLDRCFWVFRKKCN